MIRQTLGAILSVSLASCATVQPRAVPPEPEAAPEPAAAPSTASPPVKEPPAPARSSTGVIVRGDLVKVLDAAPGRFLQHVETEPAFVGGRFRGWRLASFFPGDARFSGVDLRAGDVVLSVNGQSVEQPEQLMQVWESLRSEHAIVIAIERDGRARQLRFEIRD